jgi:hypothetical protein
MVLKMEKRQTLTRGYNRDLSSKSIESRYGTCMEVKGDALRGQPFVEFTRIFSHREEETRCSHWVPLDETLEKYRIAIRGTSRVLKGGLLQGGVPY